MAPDGYLETKLARVGAFSLTQTRKPFVGCECSTILARVGYFVHCMKTIIHRSNLFWSVRRSFLRTKLSCFCRTVLRSLGATRCKGNNTGDLCMDSRLDARDFRLNLTITFTQAILFPLPIFHFEIILILHR